MTDTVYDVLYCKARRFTLLRNAYVDARYKKSYTVTEIELAWLAERVSELKKITELLCHEKIYSFTIEQTS